MNQTISINIQVHQKENGMPVLCSNIKTNNSTKAVDIAMAVTEIEKLKRDLLEMFKSDMEATNEMS